MGIDHRERASHVHMAKETIRFLQCVVGGAFQLVCLLDDGEKNVDY
jgi:hypothetical protein